MAHAEAQRIFIDAVANARTTLVMEGLGITEMPPLMATSISEGYKPPFTTVSLKGNRFITIPTELSSGPALRILFLDNNRIATLPPLAPFVSLQYLSLRSNRLSEIPAFIGDLVHVQTLDLADNFITALPTEIGKLRSLRSLSLRGNLGLHRLPLELAKQLNVTLDMEHPVEFPLSVQAAKDVLEYVCAIKARGFPIDLCNHWITMVAAERSIRVSRPSTPAGLPPQPATEAETQALSALKTLQELKAAHAQQLDNLYSDLDTPATPDQKRATRAAINTVALQLMRLNDKVSSLIAKFARREDLKATSDQPLSPELLEQSYDDLAMLSVSCDARLMRSLSKCVTRDETDRLARVLVGIAPRNVQRPLLRALTIDELSICVDAGALFRHNSFSAVVISTHQKHVGQAYLRQALRPIVLELAQSSRSFELNPAVIKVGESAADNALALESMLHRLFRALFSSLDAYPSSMRELWAEVAPPIAAKFGAVGPRLLICSFFLLRFVVPGILSPESYGIVDELPAANVKRSLMLLGSMVQKAANNGTYMAAKDPHLVIMNRVISDLQPAIQSLVETACTPPPPGRPKSPELPPHDMTVVERLQQLRWLHVQLKVHLTRIERDLEQLPDTYQGVRLYDALVARIAKMPTPVLPPDERLASTRSPSPGGRVSPTGHSSPPQSPPTSPRVVHDASSSSTSLGVSKISSSGEAQARASPLFERPLVARDKSFTVSLNANVANSSAKLASAEDGLVADFVMQLQVNDQLVRFQALMAAEGCVWSGTDTGWIYTWSTDGRQLRSFQAHQKTVYSIVRVRNMAWSSSSEGVIRVWPLELPEKATNVRVIRELPIAQNHKCLLLPQANHVISFDTSGAICMWNAETFVPERTLQLTNSIGVCSVAQLDETRVWLGLSTGELQQLSLKTWEVSEAWRAHKRRIAQLLAAGDVIWSSGDNDTIVWDISTRQNIKELPVKLHSAFYDSMSHVWGFNAAEKNATNITVWEARTGKVLQQMNRHKDAVHSFALLGRNVWASSGDSSITLWQLRPLPPAARWTKPQLPGRAVERPVSVADPNMPSEGPGSPARAPRAGSIRMANPPKSPISSTNSPARSTPTKARMLDDVLQMAERAEAALTPTNTTVDLRASAEAAPLFVSRWSFRPQNSNCLRLRAGDVVKVIDTSHAEWWYGVTNGSAGYFPGNYVVPTKPRQESVTEPPAASIGWAEEPAPFANAHAPGTDDVLMQALFSNP